MYKVYIVHEYGAPSHFYALDHLLASHDIPSSKYELNLLGQAKEVVKTFSSRSFLRMLRNLGFILSLPFLKPAKVVLGLAPYDRSLTMLRPFLKRHQVYYFTSYTCWDGSRQVHRSGSHTRSVWQAFLRNDAAHIFAVSEKTRTELIRNGLATSSNVTVVGHSYITRPEITPVHRKDNRFIMVGGLQANKGIEELLACFAARPNAYLTVVGKGPLEKKVREAESAYPNIRYAGFISDQQVLFRLYMEYSFILLNSKRMDGWEELFGMVLIEASACGLVPLAADHSGPCEIIRNGVNGIIFPEGGLTSAVEGCMAWSDAEYDQFRAAALENGRKYHVENMAGRWARVLE